MCWTRQPSPRMYRVCCNIHWDTFSRRFIFKRATCRRTRFGACTNLKLAMCVSYRPYRTVSYRSVPYRTWCGYHQMIPLPPPRLAPEESRNLLARDTKFSRPFCIKNGRGPPAVSKTLVLFFRVTYLSLLPLLHQERRNAIKKRGPYPTSA